MDVSSVLYAACVKTSLLKKYQTFSSPNTKPTFSIKSKITCQTENIIYVIYDKICKKIFHVGFKCDNMRIRWAKPQVTHK